jgi:Replication initiation factor
MTQATAKVTDNAASNTALNQQSPALESMGAKIDWISLSFKVNGSRQLNNLIEKIQDWLFISIFFDKYRLADDFTGRYKTYSGSLGVSFGYSNFDNDDICNARLTLPGHFLEQRSPWYIKTRMARFSKEFGAVCTRIDLAVDDYSKQLDHQTIVVASKNKEGIGFNVGKTIDSYGTSNDGITVYCGSRRSPKFARFYQKDRFDRFEIEYKQHYASSIFADYLADTTSDSSYLLSSILRSSISFAYKPDCNLSRSVEREWWVKFRDRIVGEFQKVTSSKPRPSLDRTLKWIHRSVSKSLLLMREALGESDMNALLKLWGFEAKLRCDQSDVDRLLQFSLNPLSLDELMAML